jgi:hypothetical protein
MTPRPSPDSAHPYTRSTAAILANVSNPTVKKLGRELLGKKASGTGNHLGFSLDDVLRIRVAKELLNLGVQVASIYSFFQSIEKDWPKLRTPATRKHGACLVLFVGPFGPNGRGGRVMLTDATDAVNWLKQTKQTVVVIDINVMIEDLEKRTGEQYV